VGEVTGDKGLGFGVRCGFIGARDGKVEEDRGKVEAIVNRRWPWLDRTGQQGGERGGNRRCGQCGDEDSRAARGDEGVKENYSAERG
jgi:hypothetical protein